ncbi:hypothetical protein RV11_GL002006 [Enterococcus phoeniculicola]|nr:hypothetical protein RV11_GL002006 [Enterococcus phoeniculicola]
MTIKIFFLLMLLLLSEYFSESRKKQTSSLHYSNTSIINDKVSVLPMK